MRVCGVCELVNGWGLWQWVGAVGMGGGCGNG